MTDTTPSPTAPFVGGPLAALAGTWVGSGEGTYPTIANFSYNERVTFTWSPKGFFAYQQATSNPVSGLPMHAESGYLRVNEHSPSVELVVAQPSGIVEVHAGSVVLADDGSVSLNLTLVSIAATPTAKSVTEVSRTITVADNTLRYSISMAAVGLPLQHHLQATLTHEH